MLTIPALRAGYRARAFTPTDVVQEILERIAARGDDHVWISRVPEAALLASAAAVDPDAPLGGIPFAVKDNIDVAGLPTTAGCPDFSYDPPVTAPAVQRLLDAGALLVGKTNMDQFATGLSGTRSPYGACESVFGGGLVSGGSSSGSAVAVAAGLVSFALGTDTAGSGRVPAALNGIVGLKPTRGLISTVGVVPACRSLDCVSVFAGNVADATAVAAVAGGPAGPWDRPAPPRGLSVPPHAVRLGVPDPAVLDFAGDEAMRAAHLAAVEAARPVVASVVSIPLGPFLEAGALLYEGALVAERLADLADFLAARPDSVLPVTRRIIESGAGYDASELFRQQHRVRELRSEVDAVFADVDALLLPTVPTTFTIAELLAQPVRHNLTLGRFTQFVNVLDLAAVALPAGLTADGRPAGVTVIGPAFSDEMLAVLADHLAPGPEVTLSPPPPPASMVLTVVGRHLRGESRHHELVERGARFEGAALTAPVYRLHLLPSGLPGLVRTPNGGAAIDVELWRLPMTAVGGFLAGVGAPLSIGRIRLADGTEHAGFLCEAYAAEGALDITAYGGWRAYQASVTRATASTSESQPGGGA